MKKLVIIIFIIQLSGLINSQPPWTLASGWSAANSSIYLLNPTFALNQGCNLAFESGDFLGCFIDSAGTGNLKCVGKNHFDEPQSAFVVTVFGWETTFYGAQPMDTLYWRIWDQSEQDVKEITYISFYNSPVGHLFYPMTQYVMDTIFLSGAPLPDFDLSVDCQTLHIVNKTIEDCVVSYAFSDGWSTADIDPFHTFPGNGVYDVTITLTNECGPTDTVIQVTINAFPEALFTFTQQDNHIQFINESYCSDSSYWDFGDGTFSAEFNPWHSYSATGMYIVTLEAISIPNNDLFTDTIFVWSISTVEDPSVAAIRIFPNPARDLLQIEISDHGFQVAELFSTDGLLVRQFRISDKHISLPVSELASGQYYLRLTGNNIVSTKKVVLLK